MPQQQKKSPIIVVSIFIIVLLILLIRFFGRTLLKEAVSSTVKKTMGLASQTADSGNVIDDALSKNRKFSVLLLGYGGGNHDGAYLTDSMILARVDPSSKTVFLISIPRDILVNIPQDKNGKYWKINAAYTIGMDDVSYPQKPKEFTGKNGGGHLSEKMVENITGIHPDRYLAMDFSAFVNAINDVGGIDVTVDQTFDDYAYPVEGKEDDLCGKSPSDISPADTNNLLDNLPTAFPCRYQHLHFEKGVVHLDGETALKFVRSRHSEVEGTDFGRSQRQRNLIIALRDKFTSLSVISKIIPLYTSVHDHVMTDFTSEEVDSIIKNAGILDKYKTVSIGLTDSNVLEYAFSDDGQYILETKEGKDKWDSVHRYIANEINSTASAVPGVVAVENGTDIPGLAKIAADRLKNEGINVLPPINSELSNSSKTTIKLLRGNLDKLMISTLEDEFKTPAVSAPASPSANYNVLITVGEDYARLHGKSPAP